MKTIMLGILAIAMAAALAIHWHRAKPNVENPSRVASETSTADKAATQPNAAETGLPSARLQSSAERRTAAHGSGQSSYAEARETLIKDVDVVASPTASFGQKQVVWNNLKQAGKLDEAIQELELRAVSNPQSAQYPAALGQAYLQKAGTLSDVREQGILGMKADQTFDAALAIDGSNWEARFFKAVAMTYWPPQLNKGEEVISHFTTLLKQQEAVPSRSEFAQTYLWLGNHYANTGNASEAQNAWQRGLSLFPTDKDLQAKLQPH